MGGDYGGAPAEVRIGFDARLSHSDIASLLDELTPLVDFIGASRWSSEPPAAEGTEIVLTIALGGGGAFAAVFIQKLAEDAYVAVRARFLETLRRARERNRHPLAVREQLAGHDLPAGPHAQHYNVEVLRHNPCPSSAHGRLCKRSAFATA